PEGARLRGARDPGNLQGHPGRQEGVPPQDATVDSTVTKSMKSAAGSHRLAPLAKAYWDAYLRQSPLFATAIGMRGYDDGLANLRRGLQGGRVAVRSGVLKVIEQIDDLAVKEVEAWPLLKPLADPHGKWKAADRTAFRDGLTSAVRDRVRPAFVRLGDVLRTEILPQARPDDRPGLMHVPGGTAAYRRLIHSYTALDLSPDELPATGTREAARINRELEAVGEKALGTSDRAEILKKLRTDPALYFRTRDEVEDKARQALA